MSPALVLAAHGTRSAEGERTMAALARAVRAVRPGYRVELGYLEISAPPLREVLSAVRGPVVVVPLLLAGGYHAYIDLPALLAARRPDARLAPPLGPHPLLTAALARRLSGAGLRAGDAVVLGAAGSADPAGLAGVRAAARHLSAHLSRPVTAAFAASGTPNVNQAVARLRSVREEPGAHLDRAAARLRAAPEELEADLDQAVARLRAVSKEPSASVEQTVARLQAAPEERSAGPRAGAGETAARRPRESRVVVASYLLAPGFFHSRLAGSGADLVSPPLGADPDVAALVWHRYDQALRSPAAIRARG